MPQCPNLPNSVGLCSKHYARLRRHGDVEVSLLGRTREERLRNQEKRFYALASRESGCLVWQGHRSHRGNYGLFHVENRMERAHRIAWEMTFGSIPNGKLVLHYCDNPPCVWIPHLYLGTIQDNNRDRLLRNGYPRDSEHPLALLSMEDARRIRSRQRAGVRQADLAKEYGVSQSLISLVVLNRRYSEE